MFNPRIASAVACDQFLAWFRKLRQRLVTLSNAVHIAVFGPTCSGKGASCIIPHLLTCPDFTVVVDCKGGENARITADFRRKKFGHRIVLLDPFMKTTKTPDTPNPFASIDKDSPFAIDDCRETATVIVERKEEKGDGVHFLDNAEGSIAAVAALTIGK